MSRVFAHRGLSASYPENTILAFGKALDAGCEGIELDVQLTRDGELVIIHDESIDRTTDGKGKVRDFSFEELRRFDASGRFAGSHGFNSIPCLSEYFDLVKDRSVITNIELKNSVFAYPGIEEKLIAMVGKYGLADRVLYSSFNHQSLLKCRQIVPRCEIAFIISSWLISAGAYCRQHGGNYINPRFGFLTKENMEELLDNGIRAMVWTVDEPEEMKRLAGMGVDSLITNEPLLALDVLGSR